MLEPGTRVGPYEILEPLGRGGMGEVYRGRDPRLGRDVAIKVLPAVLAADPQRLGRFEREATALAALDHPNIVTIFSVEEADGLHFLTMQLVRGHTLAALIPPRGMPLAQLLPIAIAIAEALAAAHQRGVIHRDLKPGNVMVTNDGQVKVLDFGLAKLRHDSASETALTEASTQVTVDGTILGTAAYMSPEQAEGRPVDQRSDIFSFGIVLYEMATGTLPFKGGTAVAVVSAILKEAPPAPSSVSSTVHPLLDRIVMRALAKQPGRRYQSAIDLRNDLDELLAPTATRARASLGPALRRRARLLGVAGGSMLVAAASWLLWRSGVPRHNAAPLRASFAQLTALPGIEAFPSLSPDGQWVAYSASVSGNLDVYLQSTSGQTPIDLTAQSPADDDQPAFSPDGQRIAFRSDREGGGIFVMGRTGEAVRRVTRFGFNPAWSPDGTRLVFATERMGLMPLNAEGDSELWVVPVEGGEPRRLSAADGVQPKWSPHGQRIVFQRRLGSRGLQMDIMTIPADGGEPTPVTGDQAADWSPTWSPDGRFVYFVSDRGGSMNLWRIAVDEASGHPRGEPEPLTTPAAFVAHPSLSADGRRIAFSSVLTQQNIQAMRFDPATLTMSDPTWLTTGSRQWSSPDPTPDGEWAVFYSRDLPEGDIFVVRLDGTGLRQVTGGPPVDRMPRWAPDGERIAYFSDRGGGPLQVWIVRADGGDNQQITQGEGKGTAVWSPDGSMMAVNGAFRQNGGAAPFLLNPARPGEEKVLPPPEEALQPFVANSWSPDGKRLAGMISYSDKGVVVFAFDSGRYEKLTPYGQWPVWLPDSRHLLFVSHNTGFYVVDTATREVRTVLEVTRDVLGPPRLTRDGRRAVYSRRHTEADIWLLTFQE
jgi:Tol biopolymer transport system component/serine/threonine protein kinase